MKQHKPWLLYTILSLACIPYACYVDGSNTAPPPSTQQGPVQIILNDIIIQGNQTVPEAAILRLIPFKKGQLYAAEKSASTIRRIYDLNRFQNVSFYLKPLVNGTYDLVVRVKEKYRVADVIISGNRQISASDISSKLNLENLSAIDESQLQALATRIKLLYAEKGYPGVIIEPQLEIDQNNNATVIYQITEKKQPLVKQVRFKGNHTFSDKTLRSIIFTKEDWLLSFMDRAGSYQKDKIEQGDRPVLESYYQNRGFLQARVSEVHHHTMPETGHLCLTYEIIEGPRYVVSDVSVKACPPYTEEQLLASVPIVPGQLYSRERVMAAIKNLEARFGNLGYIFASVNPIPIPDETTATVSVRFEIDKGQKYIVDRINIVGNRKTRDKVIRRMIILEEGQQLNTAAMEISKSRVESTGYFDMKDGVNWKVDRKPGGLADLNLVVKETKTGNVSAQMSLGGSDTVMQTPLTGLSVEFNLSDTNVMGTGIRTNFLAKGSAEEKSILFNITDPWLFDKPIFGAFDAYHQRYTYDALRFVQSAVNERHTGAKITSGFTTGYSASIFSEMFFRAELALESISYDQKPRAKIAGNPSVNLPPAEKLRAQANYDALLAREFDPGRYPWLSFFIGQDILNHPVHPSSGHTWTLRSLTGIPSPLSNIGFYRFDFDYNWYTPLIGAYDLVFHWHSYLGYVNRMGDRSIPYPELFHIGGDQNVRGFLYGQIGPQFAIGDQRDSIGGRKAAYVNAELIFPIMPDMTIKGLFFYDGGAGWDNPYLVNIDRQFVQSNSFDYRHAIGFGVRVLNPVPVRIDWGFKLDARPGETSHQVHFGMSNSF